MKKWELRYWVGGKFHDSKVVISWNQEPDGAEVERQIGWFLYFAYEGWVVEKWFSAYDITDQSGKTERVYFQVFEMECGK